MKGARQVGKTWILKELGRTGFKDFLYINFENNPTMSDLFEGSINPHRIIEYLGALHGKKIIPEDTLLIFDEIQEVPRALTSLKYFAEEAPEYPICSAGSLLGIALHEGTSFPVGKVDILTLEPLTFHEFLLANDEHELLLSLQNSGLEPLPLPLIEKLDDYLKKYFIIGGMPAALNTWIEQHDFFQVEITLKSILDTYQQDFSKHAPRSMVPKLRFIWNSIPSQLARENKKFLYRFVRSGARAREYEDALLWLLDCGLIRRVGRITKGAMPMKAYEDLHDFKIYHLDGGLLRVMSQLPFQVILERNKVFEEFNGALTQQYVLQQLSSIIPDSIYYWTSEATAEVDFIFSDGTAIIPVEVKAGVNVKAKSLRVYMDRYKPQIAIRTSLSNVHRDGSLLNIPLSMVFHMERYLELCKKPGP
ncbi:ATP-binding protein [Methanospirillum stamsii]|uniref:ATP-binding protein n=1 Tax=Methanospirillum stamsii TaxID=1277351 RepID=UPI001C640C3C|nr:ATP-binding protein [Methanospirillum stamsii]